jgi:hypothetical protein
MGEATRPETAKRDQTPLGVAKYRPQMLARQGQTVLLFRLAQGPYNARMQSGLTTIIGTQESKE